MASTTAHCLWPARHNSHPSLAAGDRARLPPSNSPAAAAPLQCARYERLGAWNSNADASCSASPQRRSPYPSVGTRRRSKPANGSFRTKQCIFCTGGSSWTSTLHLGDRSPPKGFSARSSVSRNRVATGFRNAANEIMDALDAPFGTSAQSTDGAAAAMKIPVNEPEDSKSLGCSTLPDLVTEGKHFCSKAGISGGLAAILLPFVLNLCSPDAVMAIGNEAVFPNVMTFAGPEPANALSMPTWIIHVASVAEWVAAMALVWKYGDTEGHAAWKGLAWGMVPLLGGAMCACTWHFFYNAEALEFLVAIQGFLTVVGNCTMWAAAYRIWKVSQ